MSLPGTDINPARAYAVGPDIRAQAHRQSVGQGDQATFAGGVSLAMGTVSCFLVMRKWKIKVLRLLAP